jgi:hypothetical protein
MPRLTIDNTEYVFYFNYGRTWTLNGRGTTDIATCVILAGEPGKRDVYKNVIGSGDAVRKPGDTPNRRTARAFALKRAIEKAKLSAYIESQLMSEISYDPNVFETQTP